MNATQAETNARFRSVSPSRLRRKRTATTATQVSRPVQRILLSVSIYRLFPIHIHIHMGMGMEEMPAVVSQVLA